MVDLETIFWMTVERGALCIDDEFLDEIQVSWEGTLQETCLATYVEKDKEKKREGFETLCPAWM